MSEPDGHASPKNAATQRNLLSKAEREKILRPYLPRPTKAAANLQSRPRPIRTFLQKQFHLFVYTTIHLVFSIYITIRHTYHVVFDRILAILYYHHRAPELIRQDIKGLGRIPRHLSIILELRKEDRGQASLEALMDEVAEIAAWCTCVGVPMLSVYEKTGKSDLRTL